MVKIDKRSGDWELVAIPVKDFVTHCIDYTSNYRMKLSFLCTLAAAAALFSNVSPAQDKKRDPNQIGNRDVGKGVNFYSIQQEIALGKQLAEEVRRQSKIFDDPIASEYIN